MLRFYSPVMPAKLSLHGFFLAGALLLLAACQPSQNALVSQPAEVQASGTVLGSRRYSVELTLEVKNLGPAKPDKHNLWVALIGDFPAYQQVLERSVEPADFQLVIDELGNQYAEFDFADISPGETRTVHFKYLVQVNELSYDLSICQGEVPDGFTRPELHIESANPQILTLARDLSAGKPDACQQLRAFYDYIAEKLVYSVNGANWGAQAALGPMGADCTEYAALLVALSRAAGIPARYFEGLLYQEAEPNQASEHAWADAYLPGIGWVSLDPTLGRSSIDRQLYYAHHVPNRIITTMGASPSTLRGSSYWTHLYWPGDSTEIRLESKGWEIQLLSEQ